MSSSSQVHPHEPLSVNQKGTDGAAQPPPPPAAATYQAPPQQQPAYAGGPQQPGYGGGLQQPGVTYAGGLQQPQGVQHTTVVVGQPMTMMGRPQLGASPTTAQCPHCSANVTTSTSKSCGGMLWIVAGIICLIGFSFPLLWLGCCLIPFCIPSLYDTTHTCPNCQRQIGQFKAGGGTI